MLTGVNGTTILEYRDFPQIETCEDLINYLDGREYSHKYYLHYTNIKAINSILGNGFWISCVDGFNDECDSVHFGKDKKYFYSLCFSTGINENLPLWYLYSGITGEGGRLRFTKNKIKQLIESSTYQLCEINKDKNEAPKVIIDKLVDGESMKKSFKDILYFHENELYKNKPCELGLKYNNMTNYNVPQSEFQSYLIKYEKFTKDSIWYFEKETRLLIELIGAAKEIIDKDKDYVIVMKFPADINKWIKLDFAPEISDKKYGEILSKYDNINNFVKDTSNAKLSKYHGKIHMNLCKKCFKKCDNVECKIRSIQEGNING
jgi:hypothetical protein